MSGSGAVLVPALTSTAWEGGVSSRIVLFRDWVQPRVDGTAEAREKAAKMRFAGVLKAGGIAYGENGVGRVIPFTIETDGLWEDELAAEPRELDLMPVPMPAPAPKKRKRTDAEIADSQSDDSVGDSDEDYGWADDEEAGGPTELVAPSSTTE
ncbi:MAG: hypothetical protein M1832_004523 [Thelocarpon impressellum]|nr:MAG: hypothetical protein M1832_004523 [Thelocarpon impressellum]